MVILLGLITGLLLALAWEMQARIGIVHQDWKHAEDSVHKALEILSRFEVPVAGWQVHATAWQLYRSTQESGKAESHREKARVYIFKIADSFVTGEPLRKTFLSATPIVRIIHPSAEKG